MITLIQKNSGLALILCVGSACISCDKKNPAPITPDFRLFTNKMEITDATVKANFWKRTADKFPAVPSTNSAYKITFVAPDTVKFGASTLRYSVVKKESQYLFYSPVSVYVIDKYSPVSYMLKYTAPETATPDWPGYSFMTQEVRVGYGDAKQMKLSYVQYYLIRPGNTASGLLLNELDENVKARLRLTDTLAVQTGNQAVAVQ
jgi:hypothetical protein